MWLLNTSTYQIVFVQHPSDAHYAVLSHVWAPEGEQTIQVSVNMPVLISLETRLTGLPQDVHAIHTAARSSFPDTLQDTDPRLLNAIRARLSPKIRRCCDYARARGYAYLWIDTCCIDKTSSAELSEAINSMFTWYSQADVCYVFLSDVSANDDPAEKDSSFRRSMWFKRGWTLQELIVPSKNVFLSKDWRMIGTKTSLANVIEDVTGIDTGILLQTRRLHTVSVADRMAWAAGRETTRVEDEAYSLMGVFGVRLPIIYGEGSQAFIRLQEEIMRRIPDQSLFLWGMEPQVPCCLWPFVESVPLNKLRASKSAYLFGTCPMDFSRSKGFSLIPLGTFSRMLGLPDASPPPLYTPGSYGVRTTFPVCTFIDLRPDIGADSDIKVQLAILACQDMRGRVPALLLSDESACSQHLIGGVNFKDGWCERVISRKERFTGRQAQTHSTRAQIIQPPTAAAIRYCKAFPRIILLEPSMLKNPDIIASIALRDVCIPHQRMAGVSELAVLRRPPQTEGHSFRGCCQITLPCWTLEHLSALGYSTDVVVKNGEMVPVPLGRQPGPVDGSSHGPLRCSHTFTLNHTTRGSITVTVFTCPSPYHVKSMHAAVAWRLACDSDAQLATQVIRMAALSCAQHSSRSTGTTTPHRTCRAGTRGPVRPRTRRIVDGWSQVFRRTPGFPNRPATLHCLGLG